MSDTDSLVLEALQSTQPKRGSMDQDGEALRKLKAASPAWVKDGNGIAGPQKPRSFDYPGAGTTTDNVKPIAIQNTSNLRNDPLMPMGGGGGGGKSTALPFAVTLSTVNGTAITYSIKVNYYSSLFKSYAPKDNLTITGLDTDTTVSLGDSVWLEVTILNGVATAATIKTGTGFPTGAAPWTTGAFVEQDTATPPAQTFARKLIAEVTSAAKIIQYVYEHQVLQFMCFNGRSALYPVSY
jgi:hypothetical protein